MDSTLKKLESLERCATLAKIVDTVEGMAKGPVLDIPVTHRHTPGLYIREVALPKGAHIVTKVHKVEHPFVVSAGKLLVWQPGQKPEIISAPYTGITKAGTIRLAIVLEDAVWTTFHPTDKTDVSEIETEVVMEPREALEQEQKWLLSQSQAE